MLWQINMPAAAFHSITISLVITHNLSAALAVLLFCISALPCSQFPPTCKQMEMSHRLAFFPYGFVLPARQTNGKHISRGWPQVVPPKRRRKKTRAPNEISNAAAAGLWNVTTKAFQQHHLTFGGSSARGIGFVRMVFLRADFVSVTAKSLFS